MKMNILKRLEKVERELKGRLQLKWLAVIKDTDGLYSGTCGEDLTPEQYESWLSQQGEDIFLVKVEIIENKPQNPTGGILGE